MYDTNDLQLISNVIPHKPTQLLHIHFVYTTVTHRSLMTIHQEPSPTHTLSHSYCLNHILFVMDTAYLLCCRGIEEVASLSVDYALWFASAPRRVEHKQHVLTVHRLRGTHGRLVCHRLARKTMRRDDNCIHDKILRINLIPYLINIHCRCIFEIFSGPTFFYTVILTISFLQTTQGRGTTIVS